MPAQSNAPVIIKRKKVVQGGGHHGGAWKVAYADFVTAMMAFFLLMWLLGATNEKQRKGIADFFNPSIPVNRVSGGGDGAFGGDSVFSEMTLAQNGTGADVMYPADKNGSGDGIGVDTGKGAQEEGAHAADLARIEDALMGRGGESMVTELLNRHVISRITDEGLIVEVFDSPSANLFKRDSDEPTATLSALLAAVIEVFGTVENEIAVQGHVAAAPVVKRHKTGWELSQARADRLRRMMIDGGVEDRRVARITGFADRQPASSNPLSVRNNRIELILLRDRI